VKGIPILSISAKKIRYCSVDFARITMKSSMVLFRLVQLSRRINDKAKHR
jgi:hypothetical protein